MSQAAQLLSGIEAVDRSIADRLLPLVCRRLREFAAILGVSTITSKRYGRDAGLWLQDKWKTIPVRRQKSGGEIGLHCSFHRNRSFCLNC